MSRKIASVVIATVVAVSFLFVGAGAVAADHGQENDVGVEGNCDDGENGGGGSVGVDSDGSVDDTSPSEIQSTIDGLRFYYEQNQEHSDREDTCDGGQSSDGTAEEDDPENNYDYLEVHAGNGDQQVEYCFSEDNANDGGSAGTGEQCHN